MPAASAGTVNTSAPAARSRAAAAGGAAGIVAIRVEPGSRNIRAVGGVRQWLSRTTRSG